MAGFEDDALELTEELETPVGDEHADGQDTGSDGEEALDDDEETVTFGDEVAPTSGDAGTGLVKHLREELRRVQKERDEIRGSAAPVVVEDPGSEPDFDDDADGSRWGFDHSAWKRDWLTWKSKKDEHSVSVETQQKTQKQHADAWTAEIEGHKTKKSALKFKDVQEAEDIVTATLSDVQQAVIVKAAENSAMVVYALGKHPGKLAELSKITDPLKLAAAVARLEGKLTVTKRGGPPEPERIARGSASVEAGKDEKTLAKLEAESKRTGDRSKVIAFKREMKARAN